MVSLAGYPDEAIAFKGLRYLTCHVFGSKHGKLVQLSYNYGPWVIKNHKIHAGGQNLHSKHTKLHIWPVWVDTQLKRLLSGVLDAMCGIFFI